MGDEFFIVWAIAIGFWLIVIPIIGAVIGNPKGRGVLGYVLGFLLGPIGLIVVALVGPSENQKRIDARRAAHASLGNIPEVSKTGDGHSSCRKCSAALTGKICKICGASNPEYRP